MNAGGRPNTCKSDGKHLHGVPNGQNNREQLRCYNKSSEERTDYWISRMETQKLMPMQGGTGEESYMQNSSPQNYGFHTFGKPHIANAIRLYKEYNADTCIWSNHKPNQDIIDSPGSQLIRIADYGCSYGRNTLECAQFIVNELLRLDKEDAINQLKEEKAHPQIMRINEFQYFFVDLPSNDFNTLFQMLHNPDLATFLKESRLFPVGVPGSFNNCVLPKGSVDFAITAYSVHWLSQVPPQLLDKNNPAWNGGHIWIPRNGGGAVSDAYAKQFQDDIRRFLTCRAEEMRRSGVLSILTVCRPYDRTPLQDYERPFNFWTDYLESTWNELVEEGAIEALELDTFNLPVYTFSESEFKEALQSVEELELVELHVLENCDHLPPEQFDGLLSDPPSFGKFYSLLIQSVMRPLIEAHIGKARASQVFDRLQVIATKNAHLTKSLSLDLLIAIIRKK